MKGYFRGVGTAPCIPADRAATDRLIELFRISRTLYELHQELDKHLTAIVAPVDALLSTLERAE